MAFCSKSIALSTATRHAPQYSPLILSSIHHSEFIHPSYFTYSTIIFSIIKNQINFSRLNSQNIIILYYLLEVIMKPTLRLIVNTGDVVRSPKKGILTLVVDNDRNNSKKEQRKEEVKSKTQESLGNVRSLIK